MSRQESAKEFRSLVEQITTLEEELHDIDVQLKDLDKNADHMPEKAAE